MMVQQLSVCSLVPMQALAENERSSLQEPGHKAISCVD